MIITLALDDGKEIKRWEGIELKNVLEDPFGDWTTLTGQLCNDIALSIRLHQERKK